MDQDKKELLKELNQIYNNRFKTETIGNILYHIPMVNELTSKYNQYTFCDFIFICRLDCLLDCGLITEQKKDDLLELANLYRQLWQEFESVNAKKNILTEDEYNNKCSIICDKLAKIDLVFDNYHLYDAINLTDLVLKKISVDDINFDMSEAKVFLKK